MELTKEQISYIDSICTRIAYDFCVPHLSHSIIDMCHDCGIVDLDWLDDIGGISTVLRGESIYVNETQFNMQFSSYLTEVWGSMFRTEHPKHDDLFMLYAVIPVSHYCGFYLPRAMYYAHEMIPITFSGVSRLELHITLETPHNDDISHQFLKDLCL